MRKAACLLVLLLLLAFCSTAEEFTAFETGQILANVDSIIQKKGFFDLQALLEHFDTPLLEKVVAIGQNELNRRVSRMSASVPEIPPDAVPYKVGLYSCPADIPPGTYALYTDTTYRLSESSAATIHKGSELLWFAIAEVPGLGVFTINDGEILQIDYWSGLINPIHKEMPFIHKPGDWFNLPTSRILVGTHIPPGEYSLVPDSKDNAGTLQIFDENGNRTNIEAAIGESVSVHLQSGQIIASFFAEMVFVSPEDTASPAK